MVEVERNLNFGQFVEALHILQSKSVLDYQEVDSLVYIICQ